MAVRKTKKGAALKRWFKEEWIDVRTGKPCGRKKGEKRGVPYCRPKKKVSSKFRRNLFLWPTIRHTTFLAFLSAARLARAHVYPLFLEPAFECSTFFSLPNSH